MRYERFTIFDRLDDESVGCGRGVELDCFGFALEPTSSEDFCGECRSHYVRCVPQPPKSCRGPKGARGYRGSRARRAPPAAKEPGQRPAGPAGNARPRWRPGQAQLVRRAPSAPLRPPLPAPREPRAHRERAASPELGGTNGSNGARGTTGSRGPTGTQGTAGSGGVTQYAYLYNTSVETVEVEADVIFDSNGLLTSGFTHAASPPPSRS